MNNKIFPRENKTKRDVKTSYNFIKIEGFHIFFHLISRRSTCVRCCSIRKVDYSNKYRILSNNTCSNVVLILHTLCLISTGWCNFIHDDQQYGDFTWTLPILGLYPARCTAHGGLPGSKTVPQTLSTMLLLCFGSAASRALSITDLICQSAASW